MDLSKLDARELVELCEGADCWHTRAVPRLGLHPLMMADGPHGCESRSAWGICSA